MRDPRSVLAEFGTRLDDGVAVRVHDSTADMRYLVLPLRPPGTPIILARKRARRWSLETP